MSSGDSHKYPNGQPKSIDAEKGLKSEIPILRLHKRPFLTVYYALMESFYLLMQFITYILSHKRLIIILFVSGFSLLSVNMIEGAHKKLIWEVIKKLQWWSWWVLLGFLSSCGFGSGLHTFVLYLGPFIAKVTMAAYECGSTDFPEPPYPEELLCPSAVAGSSSSVGTFAVVHKVLLESVLWGVGTAIGELPPYFMARAAALSSSASGSSNCDLEDDSSGNDTEWSRRCRAAVRTLVRRAGFMGIMLCASVPNPLFDLAGMTCGHFLVPFSTFFGATLLGKAINKMTLQMIFVVLVFSRHELIWIQSIVRKLPRYGETLSGLIDEFLVQQKERIHKSIVSEKQSWLSAVFGWVQLAVVAGFLISIVHSLADNYADRLTEWQLSYSERLVQSAPTVAAGPDNSNRSAKKTH